MESSGKTHNRLISEKSPYLLQHAGNPVDWYPWGDEAFEKARREDKPVFLSIGYSTCHWCHVMAHESFEDPEVARLMNEAFVSVKVDREERPDIDNLYMSVAQLVTGSGGWPLTIVMTPDKRPFFAGTYIPRETRSGRTGMKELIPRLKELWQARRNDLLDSADKITGALQQMVEGEPGADLTGHLLSRAYEELARRFDPAHGGFGRTPKFPTPHNLLFLLRYWRSTGDKHALEMVEKTLRAMSLGGIRDHVGFGFHRYSTDQRWLVPHFEKMLYDQALLAMAYIEAYQATGKPDYRTAVEEIFTYVRRDMTSPEGGFYSAEDADSEGVEGKFYVWTEREIRDVLDKEQAELIIRLFNVTTDGNFSEEATGQRTGANILHLGKAIGELAADYGLSAADLRQRVEESRTRLFARRESRVHPGKDDKVLTDWNGLMIAALAKGAQAFQEPAYAEAARHAADFLLRQMRLPDGQLLHRYRGGEAALPGYAEDYAFLIWGLTELYEAGFETAYLKSALDLNAYFLEHFWDREEGGFFSTHDQAEKLLARQRTIYDGAVPSANSVAMLNLLRLGRMTGNPDLEARAAEIGRAFSGMVERMPMGFTQLLCALHFVIGPSYEVVIAGNSKAADTMRMIEALQTRFIPNKIVLLNPLDEASPAIWQIADFTKHLVGIEGKATAYVCMNYNCKRPVTDTGELLALIENGDASRAR